MLFRKNPKEVSSVDQERVMEVRMPNKNDETEALAPQPGKEVFARVYITLRHQ